MNITSLANEAIGYLVPAMPFLLATGKTLRDKAIEKVGQSFGEEGFKLGKSLWAKLGSKVEAKPAALEAAKDLANDPNDADNQASFRKELKKILADDEALAAEIKQILEEAKAASVNVVQSGDRNVFSVGDHNINITGDGNTEASSTKMYKGMELTIKNQLADYGVTIEKVSGRQAAGKLASQYAVPATLVGELEKFSITIRNDSSHHIMAITVLWNFHPSSGPPISNIYSYTAMDAIFNNVSYSLIPAGNQQVMCLLASNIGIGQLHSVEMKDEVRAQQQLARLNGLLAQSVKWSVEIDSLLLSNGLFVGPDNAHKFDALQSGIQGGRDMIAELSQKTDRPGDFFDHAGSYAAVKADDLEARFPDIRVRMASPQFAYESSKRQIALRVLAQRQNSDQAALDFVTAAGRNQIALLRGKD